jgi:hypothetical protein
MLVFYSPDNFERLAIAQTFFMDGTFSVAPHPFKQLYTIAPSHNLGKDLAGFVSGVGCQVFHEISGF